MRLATRYLDRQAKILDGALAIIDDTRAAAPLPSAPRQCHGDLPSSSAACGGHGHRPDVRARSSTAICPRAGPSSAGRLRRTSGPARVGDCRRETVDRRSRERDARVRAARHLTFDYSNNIRQVAHDEGVSNAFAFPGSCPRIRPLFCEGKGPSLGRPVRGPEHLQDRPQGGQLFPDNAHAPLARHGEGAHRFRVSRRASAGSG